MLTSVMPQQANYYYFTHKGSKDQYFYTTRKIEHKGNQRYVAGIYRYIKTKNALKLVRKSGFAKKKKAIAVATDWSERGL